MRAKDVEPDEMREGQSYSIRPQRSLCEWSELTGALGRDVGRWVMDTRATKGFQINHRDPPAALSRPGSSFC